MKSVVWREAWKREVRRVRDCSEGFSDGGFCWRARWAKCAICVGLETESKRLRMCV